MSVSKLSFSGSFIRREFIAGLASFLAMSYIVFVNPEILGAAGMPQGALFTATIVVTVIATLSIGIFSNYPLAAAPGLGLSSFFTYTLVKQMGLPWQTALGLTVITSFLFLIISISSIRSIILKHFPLNLKRGIVIGIGFFLMMIGLHNANLIVPSPNTLVQLGDLASFPVLMSILGLFIILIFDYYKQGYGILLSISFVTFLAYLFGFVKFDGFFSMPPSIGPVLFKANVMGALKIALIPQMIAMFIVLFFDASGTIMAGVSVLEEKGIKKQDKSIKKPLIADSFGSFISPLFGTSPSTIFLESLSSISSGGRTGLSSVFTAIFFALVLFFSPIIKIVPIYATAPVLIFIGIKMAANFKYVPWDDVTEFAPIIIMAIVMPLTFSISYGIAFGLISYCILKIFSGKYKSINLIVMILTIIFIFNFYLLLR